MPRSAAPGSASIGSSGRKRRIWRANIEYGSRIQVSICVTDNCRGRASVGGQGAAGAIEIVFFGLLSSARSLRQEFSVEYKASSAPAPRTTASRRVSQRDGTLGCPSDLSARVRTTSGAAKAGQNHVPSARCGAPAGASRQDWRIGRLSHGSGCGPGGQIPSFKPPSTTRSACCKRASSNPRMARRGCRPNRGRTVQPAHQGVQERPICPRWHGL